MTLNTKRTLEQAAVALRAEFGTEIVVITIDPKPDPKDGKNTLLNYKWWRTCNPDWVRDVLKSLSGEIK